MFALRLLHDDVLAEIFSFLPLSFVLHHLCLTSKHWHYLAKNYMRHLTISTDVIKNPIYFYPMLSLKYVDRTLVQFPGLKSLQLSRMKQTLPQLIQSISECVPLLISLEISHCKAVSSVSLDQTSFSNLTELNLTNCDRVATLDLGNIRNNRLLHLITKLNMSHTSITDEFFTNVLVHFTSLSSFTAKSCKHIVAPKISNSTITELNFRQCGNLIQFSDNLQSIRKLKYLNLSACLKLNQYAMCDTFNNIKESIEILEVRNCSHLFPSNPLNFDKLKCLFMHGAVVNDLELVGILDQCENLKVLELGGILAITEPYIIHERLEYLYLDNTGINTSTQIQCDNLIKFNAAGTNVDTQWLAKSILASIQRGTLRSVIGNELDNITSVLRELNDKTNTVPNEVFNKNLANVTWKYPLGKNILVEHELHTS
jgi:hypothetical protein